MEGLAIKFRCKRDVRGITMFFRYLFIFLIIITTKSFALIEVDITRGNLSPLPIAVSPLSLDNEIKNKLKKILEK